MCVLAVFYNAEVSYRFSVGGRGVWSVTAIILSKGHITEKRADHSLRDEQGRFRPRSFLCAVAPRFSVDIRLCNDLVLAIYDFQLQFKLATYAQINDYIMQSHQMKLASFRTNLVGCPTVPLPRQSPRYCHTANA